jgi:hypothetical protein
VSEHHHDSDYACPPIEANYGPLRRTALIAAIVGTLSFAGLAIADIAMNKHGLRDVFLTYQAAFVYWVSLPIGGMTLLLIGYLCSTSWALVLRRCFQAAIRTWFLMFLLFLPIVVSLFVQHSSSFWWVVPAEQISNGDAVVQHEIEHRQKLYLNAPFFLLRAGLIFAAFALVMRALLKWGIKSEDDGDTKCKGKLVGLAGPGILLWALLFTVGMTDWVMSVEPAWFSSMFPVVAGMNCFLTTLALSALVFYTLIGENQTALSIVKDKFRIDIGSLMMGFTMVWSYASFCQFMLIWAGNLPEEIGYYKKRLNGGWEYMAYALMLVHWFLPFLLFLFREVKTSPKAMQKMTLMLLAICAIDVIWWIVPCVNRTANPETGENLYMYFHVPMAFAAIAMVGGIWGLVFLSNLRRANLLPKKDTEFLANWGHH